MGINWFEGGRRITSLFQWLVGLGFAGYIIFTPDPDAVLFETYLPSQQFAYSTEKCGWPDEKKEANSIYFPDGELREIELCFRAQPDENIIFLQTVADKDDPDKGFKKGDKLISYGRPYDSMVDAYISNRVQNPSIKDWQLELAQDNLWKRKPTAIWTRFEETFLFAAGAIVFIWLFSSVVGWIIRGFSGIPRGQDFRSIE